jgi:hypothetical protein
LELIFVAFKDDFLLQVEEIGIDSPETVGLFRDDGFLQFTNGLFWANFDRKRLCVAADPAEQDHRVGLLLGLERFVVVALFNVFKRLGERSIEKYGKLYKFCRR